MNKKIKGKYKFVGRPDWVFPNLKTGYVYDLEIVTNKYSLLKGGIKRWFFREEYPVIVKPIVCPYSSWDTFRLNWMEKVK